MESGLCISKTENVLAKSNFAVISSNGDGMYVSRCHEQDNE